MSGKTLAPPRSLAKLVFIPALVCVCLESSRAGHTVETCSVRSEFISSSMTVF